MAIFKKHRADSYVYHDADLADLERFRALFDEVTKTAVEGKIRQLLDLAVQFGIAEHEESRENDDRRHERS